MSCIHPFKGVRPAPEYVEKVASPPYDVLNSAEAREMAGKNKYSFLHVVKSEIDLPENIDQYDDAVYRKARENLVSLMDDGVLIQDETPRFYVYTLEMEGHRQSGIIGCFSGQEYLDNHIRKHEHTRKAKEDDRIRHIETTRANTGPVLLTYKAKDEIDKLVSSVVARTPVYDFTADDGVRHIVHMLEQQGEINRLVELFQEVNPLYIADGHHRSAAASLIYERRRKENPGHTGNEEYCYFLGVIFPDDQLQILAYNRVLKDLNGMSSSEFLEKLADKFDVKQDGRKVPDAKLSYCIYLDKKWYTLTYKNEIADDPLKSLDVAIVQNEILGPLFGITKPKEDKRIDFVGGTRGTAELEKLVDSGEFSVAVSMYPTSIDDLISVAEALQIMPPKSTWFAPKLRSGIMVHLLDE